MTLGSLTQSRLTLLFEYRRRDELVARGEQQIAYMRRQDGKLLPAPVPELLRDALRP
jgi:enediyne biosynthesis thioesterase